jgi:hypothetical protein
VKYRFRAAKSFRRALAKLAPEEKRLAAAAFKIFKQIPSIRACDHTRFTSSQPSTAKPFMLWKLLAICEPRSMSKAMLYGALI